MMTYKAFLNAGKIWNFQSWKAAISISAGIEEKRLAWKFWIYLAGGLNRMINYSHVPKGHLRSKAKNFISIYFLFHN